MKKNRILGLLAAALFAGPMAASAALLTDITVFSSNSDGHRWNDLIWNTQGLNTDPLNRWNLYISNDPLSDTTPTFINSYNDDRTRVSLDLAPGSHTFSIFGNGVGSTFDPRQHFVLNLYFGGVQSAPGISGVQNLDNSNLRPAGNPNGWDIFGQNWQQEAGSLSALIADQLVTLTSFSWITASPRDVVYPYHANDAPYSAGGQGLDYYGSFTLRVESVPEPGTLALFGLGLAAIGYQRRKRAA